MFVVLVGGECMCCFFVVVDFVLCDQMHDNSRDCEVCLRILLCV